MARSVHVRWPHARAAREASRSATLAETRALAHPLRLRIIRLLYDRSLTNRELAPGARRAPRDRAAPRAHAAADRLHRAPSPSAAARGARSRSPTGRPGGRGTSTSTRRRRRNEVARASIDAFMAEVSRVPDASRLSTTRAPMRLTEERREEFQQKLLDLVDEYAGDVERGEEPDEGERLALFISVYPAADGYPPAGSARRWAAKKSQMSSLASISIVVGPMTEPIAALNVGPGARRVMRRGRPEANLWKGQHPGRDSAFKFPRSRGTDRTNGSGCGRDFRCQCRLRRCGQDQRECSGRRL